MLYALKDWLFGKRSSRGGRRAAPARLGLEMLEAREVPSASGFTLTSGNLFNSAGTKIDAGVAQFAVVNNKVYDLHTNAALHSLNGDGSGNTILETGVQSLGLGDDGNAYYLQNEKVWSSASNTPVDSSVVAMSVSASGLVFDQESNGNLNALNPATGAWGFYGSGTQSIGRGDDGNIYYLQKGNVWSTASSQPADVNVASMVVSPGGWVFDLEANGNLNVSNPAVGGWLNVDSNVTSVVIDGAGSLFALHNADGGFALSHFDPGSTNRVFVDSNVTSVAINGTGSLFALHNADGGFALSYFAPGSTNRVFVDTSVESFAFTPTGDLIVLQTNGNLYNYRNAFSSSNYFLLDNTVHNYAFTPTGDLIVLQTDGNLYDYRNASSGSNFFLLTSFVESLAASSQGGVYFLTNTTSGGWLEMLGETGAQVMGTNIQSFAIADSGTIYVIRQDGSLWGELGQLGSTWAHILDDVSQISVAADGNALAELGSGLQAELAVSFNPESGALSVNLNDIEFNVGWFTNDVLAPIIEAIQKVTLPLESVAQFLADPIPVLSSIDPGVTVASLIGKPAIATAANAIIAINHLALPTGSNWISLGSISCLDANPGAEQALSIFGNQLTAFSSQITSAFAGFEQQVKQIGLDFPVLDNPSELIQLASGQNVPLFTYTLPALNVSWSSEPLLAVIPTPIGVSVDIYAQLGASVQLGGQFGCNSSGLLSGQLLNSFFAENVSASFSLSVGLVGELNAVVAGLDIGGGITAQANLSLNGPGGSNMVTGTNLVNGSVQVALSGSVSAYADASVWVGVDIPFVGFVGASFTLFDIHVPLFSF